MENKYTSLNAKTSQFTAWKKYLTHLPKSKISKTTSSLLSISRDFTHVPWYIFSYYFGFFCSTFSRYMEKIVYLYCLRQRSIRITYQRLYKDKSNEEKRRKKTLFSARLTKSGVPTESSLWNLLPYFLPIFNLFDHKK